MAVTARIGFVCNFLLLYLLSAHAYYGDFSRHAVELKVGVRLNCSKSHEKKLEIYCYPPQSKSILHIWKTVSVSVSIPFDQFEFYLGPTSRDVLEQFESDISSWKINIFSSKSQKIILHPFNGSCLGIHTDAAYNTHLNIIWVDFWKVLMLCGGLALFIFAPKLSHNAFFYYLCGMALGVCASFLFILFLFSKFLPRKPAFLMFMVGGWTVSVYLLQLIWNNIQVILVEYPSFAVGYTTLASLISFIICYRFGPVTDPRSKNLIKWTLQVSSLGLIFFSSEFQDATIAIIILLLTVYLFPSSWSHTIKSFWRRKFPPKLKLLTETEFIEEGVVETTKSLSELKTHCSSPDCNAWKTILRLKDPQRFASFIEGNSHISDEEIIQYERHSDIPVTELLTEESDSESD